MLFLKDGKQLLFSDPATLTSETRADLLLPHLSPSLTQHSDPTETEQKEGNTNTETSCKGDVGREDSVGADDQKKGEGEGKGKGEGKGEAGGDLVVKEDRRTGIVSSDTYKAYLRVGGYGMSALVVLLFCLQQVSPSLFLSLGLPFCL